ncbi:DUF202 domain-containing protein [Georgenia yuyongxinii]|uniref:DUF202 domain-containing protein n=1 Tax=Georgenia yuyongxinii TaxID=2589797 RepID=UPI00163D736F|nr:DUF202 domain-containing protein [Georgenia yuyongxinii]
MTRPGAELFDPGLQPERTALAWRRTALALALGPLLAARLFAPQLGALTLAAALVGAALGASIALVATARYRTVHGVLVGQGERRGLPGAALLLGTAAVTFLAGIGALALVISRL